MFCDIRLKLRRVRACLTIVLASTATLGMPNQALAAYDFSKLGAAIETLSPETVSDWEKKARAGDAMAQNLMGLAYKCGMGVKQNHAASIQWFRRAAEQGEADAQFNLGRLYGSEVDGMYKNGRAAPANDAEAFKWYRLAAEQGHTQAQVRLAQLFAKGLTDIAPDQVQAYQWMSLAAASGEPTAAKVVADYAAQMKPEQLQQAQLLAEEWQRRQGTK
ncbi:sel1 repeat family protein [Arthrobacter frigidicola]|nr:sel1 repeat family protein [Arthrobacter frigidicola]